MKNENFSEVFAEFMGWYGAVAILAAYFLVSFDKVPADGAVFQLLNLTGAFGLIIIALYKRVIQSVVLNLFWAGVAILALISLWV